MKRRTNPAERQAAVSAAMARDQWRCQAAPLMPETECAGGLDGHEPLTRARGGSATDVDNILTVCRVHHDQIHANPARSLELGLLQEFVVRMKATIENPFRWVATWPDGTQVLVTDWGEGTLEIAKRETKRDIWGAPEDGERA